MTEIWGPGTKIRCNQYTPSANSMTNEHWLATAGCTPGCVYTISYVHIDPEGQMQSLCIEEDEHGYMLAPTSFTRAEEISYYKAQESINVDDLALDCMEEK